MIKLTRVRKGRDEGKGASEHHDDEAKRSRPFPTPRHVLQKAPAIFVQSGNRENQLRRSPRSPKPRQILLGLLLFSVQRVSKGFMGGKIYLRVLGLQGRIKK